MVDRVDATTCNGVTEVHSTISAGCSNNGYCISDEVCSCFSGYAGPYCATLRTAFTYSSGLNDNGQLGDGFLAQKTTPTRVAGWFGPMSVVTVSSGFKYSLALTTKGEVWAWGYNKFGVLGTGDTNDRIFPTMVQGVLSGKKIVDIAACYYHSMAVDDKGVVYTWGTNRADYQVNNPQFLAVMDFGWLGVPQDVNNPDPDGASATYNPVLLPAVAGSSVLPATVNKVSCGRMHSNALTADGKLWAWGSGQYGQLGDASTSAHPVPFQVTTNIGTAVVVQIASGYYHNLALTSEGKLYSWGQSTHGQLGDANNMVHLVAAPLFIGGRGSLASVPVIRISAGTNSSYAITNDNVLHSWGQNGNNQLAFNDATISFTSLPSTNKITQAVTNVWSSRVSDTVFVYTTTNELFGFGNNLKGNIAIGTTGASTVPTKVNVPFTDTTFSDVGPGDTQTLFSIAGKSCFSIYANDPQVCTAHGNCTALDTCSCEPGYTGEDCSLPICFGLNSSDPLVCSGHGSCMTIDTCVCYSGYKGDHCSVRKIGYLYGAGDNSFGQLADGGGGFNVRQYIPVRSISFSSQSTHISSGVSFSLILLSDNSLYAVGSNKRGQIGDGTTIDAGNPVLVPGPWISAGRKIVDMCAGLYHSVAVDDLGKVYTWGDNSFGQLGSGNTISSSTPAQVGGVLTDQMIVSVACGLNSSSALAANNTMYSWGRNVNGEMGDNTVLNRLVPTQVFISGILYKRRVSGISMGATHTLAIVDDGYLYSWGGNGYGQLGDNTVVPKYLPLWIKGNLDGKIVTGISAGGLSSYAVTSDGGVYSWGDCSTSQLGTGCAAGTSRVPQLIGGFGTELVSSVSAANINFTLASPTIESHVLAITRSFNAFTWGANSFGQLGDGTIARSAAPKRFNSMFPLRPVQTVSASATHSLIIYGGGIGGAGDYICFGVLPDEPQVCSYRGNCTAADTCNCLPGYSGPDCSIYACYGVNSTESSVCSGVGFCIASDSCRCKVGYVGDRCEIELFGLAFALGRQDSASTQYQLGNDDPTLTYSPNMLIVQGGVSRKFVKIVDGAVFYSLALTTDGELYTWGRNNNGQVGDNTRIDRTRPYLVLQNITEACADLEHFAAVSADGTVYGSGAYITSTGGILTPVVINGLPSISTDPAMSIACGRSFVSVLTSSGQIYSFGQSIQGQLGYGDTPAAMFTPKRAVGIKNVVQIEGGSYHQIALTSTGQVFTWGLNSNGQLGDGTTTQKNVPTPVYGALLGKVVTYVAAGALSSYAITNEGAVYSWGDNSRGQLGDGTITQRNVPVLVQGMSQYFIRSIHTGKENGYVIAITNNGNALAWGYNSYANLGKGSTSTYEALPVLVINTREGTIVSAGPGQDHTLFIYNGTFCYGILSDDPLVCSRRGNCSGSDQCVCDLGYSGADCSLTTCFGISSSSNVTCSGRGTCVALDSCSCLPGFSGRECTDRIFGYTYTVGKNDVGQLGDDYFYNMVTPQRTSRPLNFRVYAEQIASGIDLSFAVDGQGTVYSWGTKLYGRQGDGQTSGFNKRPVIPFSMNVVSIASSAIHTVIADSQGRVFSWGWNVYDFRTTCTRTTSCCGWCTYYCGTYSCTSNYAPCNVACLTNIPVIIGHMGVANLYYSFAPIQVSGLPANDPVVQVASGRYHTLLLTSGGRVFGFGENTRGQVGTTMWGSNVQTPVDVTTLFDFARVIAIDCGEYFSMALGDHGEVYVWGGNTNGQLGDGTSGRDVRHPKMVSGLIYKEPIVRIAAGREAAYALSSSGEVFSWGANNLGQLGINSTISLMRIPSQVPLLSNMSFIGAGVWADYVIVSSVSNGAYGWGDNSFGVLGDGAASAARIAPRLVNNPYPNRYIVAIAPSQYHTVFLYNGTYCFDILADDPLVCSRRGKCIDTDVCSCDEGYYGPECDTTLCFNVSSNSNETCSGRGTCVGLDSCHCLSSYSGENCELLSMGMLFSVGRDNSGQLGIDDVFDRLDQVQIGYPLGPGRYVKKVFAGSEISWAIAYDDGSLFSWGSSAASSLTDSGRLGSGSMVGKINRPVKRSFGSGSFVDVCSGLYNTVAVDSNGYVFSWGWNSVNQRDFCQRTYSCSSSAPCTTYPCGDKRSTCHPYCTANYPVTTGLLGLGSDLLYTFSPTRVTQFSETDPAIQVACGVEHVLVLTASGKVYGWGSNNNGQVGDGSYSSPLFSPVRVGLNTPVYGALENTIVIQIAAGKYHSMALSSNGEVYTWGYNSNGQIGDGTLNSQRFPTRVEGEILFERVTNIAAGDLYSVVSTSDGKVFAWGGNANGQMGINAVSASQLVPLRVSSVANSAPLLNNVTGVSAGSWSPSLIATTSYKQGPAYSWGANPYGLLADGTATGKLYPSSVVNNYDQRRIIMTSIGDSHTLIMYNSTYCFGILSDDPVVCSRKGVCTGSDTCQCYAGSIGSDCSVNLCQNIAGNSSSVCSGRGVCVSPNKCVCDLGWTGDNCENSHTGYTFTVGNNAAGQLGNDYYDNELQIVQTASPLSSKNLVLFVTSGADTTFAIDENYSLYAWGSGRMFNLIGDGLNTDTNIPKRVMAGTNYFKSVCSSTYHTVAVDSSGVVWSWGSNMQSLHTSVTCRRSSPSTLFNCVNPTNCNPNCNTDYPLITGQLGIGDLYYSTTPEKVLGFDYTQDVIRQVACGLAHTLAITEDGRIFGWGQNIYNQLGDPSHGSYVRLAAQIQSNPDRGEILKNKKLIKISAGHYHSMTLDSLGRVYVWGRGSEGVLADGLPLTRNQPHARVVNDVLLPLDMIDISAGRSSCYVVTTDGKVYGWGLNNNYQLGLNHTLQQNMPTLIDIPENITQISAGRWQDYAIAVSSRGAAYAWGLNAFGQLGIDKTITTRTIPTRVASTQFSESTFIMASASMSHSVFIVNGTYCYGILSDDTSVCSFRGLCIGDDVCVCDQGYENRGNCSIANCYGTAGDNPLVCSGNGRCMYPDYCSCYPGYSGATCDQIDLRFLYASGDDTYSQLGDGFFVTQNTPKQSSLFARRDVHFTSAGDGNSFAVDLNSLGAYAWGLNDKGQLGDGSTFNRFYPTKILKNQKIRKIQACMSHTLAIDVNGILYTFGSNTYGQLGTGNTDSYLSPVSPPSLLNETILDIACGGYHSIVVTNKGVVFAFGLNDKGQLGSGTTTAASIPTQVGGILNTRRITKVSAGNSHSLALSEDGVIFAWGDNIAGQLGDGKLRNRVYPYPITSHNVYGCDIISVVGGALSSYALLSNGTVFGWGSNQIGELGDSSSTANVLLPVEIVLDTPFPTKKITAGRGKGFAVFLTSNGTAFAVGENLNGQLGDATFVSPRQDPIAVSNTLPQRYITDVNSGSTHTLYLYSGVACFGIVFDDPTVCSWRGNCTATDTCECPPSYGGNDCSIAQCYGVNATSPNVCSSNGRCVSLDTCVCHLGYGGRNCEISGYGYLFASGDDSNSQLGQKNIGMQADVLQSTLFIGKVMSIIVPSYQYTFLRTLSGAIYAYGNNAHGQLGDGTTVSKSLPVQILSGMNIISICGGFSHAMALDNLGQVYAWGSNLHGALGVNVTSSSVPIPVSSGDLGIIEVVAISCGYHHSMALTTNGTIYTWGDNSNGQLGDSTLTSKFTPTLVGGLLADKFIVSIDAGANHSVALGSDGTVYSWGDNSRGQLGDTTTTQKILPVQVAGLLYGKTVSQISAGGAFTCVVSFDGSVYCWGANDAGQNGDGTLVDRLSPVQVTSLPTDVRIMSVSAGGQHALALAENNTAYSWGSNLFGQLGDGGFNISAVTRPVRVAVYYPDTYPTVVVAGDTFSLYLFNGTTCFGKFSEDPSVCSTKGVCTGSDKCTCFNYYNAPDCSSFLCFNKNASDPSVCSGRGTCMAADACVCRPGYDGSECEHSIAGMAFAVGSGANGQAGNGYRFSENLFPTAVGGPLSGVVLTHVASGITFSAGLTSDGRVFTWGLNNVGQLGDGSTQTRLLPVLVTGLENSTIRTLCVGGAHVTAVDTDGVVWTWGDNSRGQLGNNDYSFLPSSVPIQVGGMLQNLTVAALACGDRHTLALTYDGMVIGWGNNEDGQLGDGTNEIRLLPIQTGVGVIDKVPMASIYAGLSHSLAIGPFGVIYAWGRNSYGQLGEGSTFNKYVPTVVAPAPIVGKTAIHLAANDQNSYARFSDNTIFAWGGNFFGQIGCNTTEQSRPIPVFIGGGVSNETKLLFASRYSAFGLTSSGKAYSWGVNSGGQLGDGRTDSRLYPVQVVNPFSERVISLLAPGFDHTLFLYNGSTCYGYLSDDPLVCSSRGKCVAIDQCQCKPGFEYLDCSMNVCNEKNNTDPLVCSSNGFCLPNNTCVCSPEISGIDCEQTSFGFMYATGKAQSGQLGDGSLVDTSHIIKSRAPLLDRQSMKFVTAGSAFTLAVSTDGKLFAVGANEVGQLGDGTTTGRTTPVITLFSQLNMSLSTVTAGGSFAVAVASNGSVFTWGNNANGQLGLGFNGGYQTKPVLIQGLTDLISISCGTTHCLGLTRDGKIFSWGQNSYGQLGDGSSDSSNSQYRPGRVLSIFNVKKAVYVFAGQYHSLAISVDGIPYSWGDNSRGELGSGTTFTNYRTIPEQVIGFDEEIVTQVTGGDHFSCALTKGKQVWCWGANTQGQLGSGHYDDILTPTRVEGLLSNVSIVRITGGANYMLSLDSFGVLYGWGANTDGQLGDYTIVHRPSPIVVGNFTLRYAEYVATGVSHSLFLYNGTTCFNQLMDDPDVCSGNGTCVDWDTCMCKPGFSGRQCEFTSCFGINMTSPEVCTGHGVCKYLNTCICDYTKYDGNMCQFEVCFGKLSNNPTVCSSHGVCVGPGNCSCHPGYNGPECQFTICHGRNTNDSLVCSGKGLCLSPGNCLCYNTPLPGYTGGNCSYPVCYSRYMDRLTGQETISQLPTTTTNLVIDTSNVCSGHGTCTTPNKCSCHTGWTDPYCSTPICGGLNATNPAVCNYGKNGTCISYNNCTCLTKFDAQGFCVPLTCFGKNSTTSPPACNSDLGQGNCLNVDLCACVKGYGGQECEQTVCNGILQYNFTHICHGRGYCNVPSLCTCNLGYNGTDCQYTDCYGKLDVDEAVCSGHGVCIKPHQCQCDEGYAGNQCQHAICYGLLSNDTQNVCSNHGKCSAPDTCDCDYGYSGLECVYPSCYDINSTKTEVCSTHGVCYKPDRCNCTTGYTSKDCSIPLCYGIWGTNRTVCSSRGFCLEPDTCLCSEGSVGGNCELNYCYGYNETDLMVCNSHGKCIGPQKCNCTPNEWTGPNCDVPICFGKSAIHQQVCSGKGSCIFSDTCQCVTGRTGENCELNICFGLNETDSTTCSGHGTCYGVDKCNCTYGWKNQDCSLPICFGIPADHRDTCSGFGDCIAADLCNCSRTYGKTGNNCQLQTCYGINETDPSVCSQNGTCTGVDSCSCLPGKIGSQCEFNICFSKNQTDPTVCHGHGACVSPNGCKCDESSGYTGVECEIPICYGIRGDNATVCSTFGECIQSNTCECVTGKTGILCDVNICYGVNGTNLSVCSGHGVCTEPDTCFCSSTYSGKNCQIPICYGISADDSRVCSSYGNCTSPGNCNCVEGKTGVICEFNLCYGRAQNDLLVCSGHGVCAGYNSCRCEPQYAGNDCSSCISGYTGAKCLTPICFGVSSTDSSVCSGNGQCISPDRCLCDNGFAGSNCEAVKDECTASTEFILVTIPDNSRQNISLVDMNCGKTMYHFNTILATRTFYNRYQQRFLMISGVDLMYYSYDDHMAHFMRKIPSIDLEKSAIFVISQYQLQIVSLTNEVDIYLIDIRNPSDDNHVKTSLFQPVDGLNDERFITRDYVHGVTYWIARSVSDQKVSVLKLSSDGTMSEYSKFLSFPTTRDIQALMHVNNELYLILRSFIYKIEVNKLTFISDMSVDFFASYKTESDQHIYLDDKNSHLLSIIPKNMPIDISLSKYPRDISLKDFVVIGDWKPRITSITPSNASIDRVSTWIHLDGEQLHLNGESSITLIDPNSDVSVTTSLVPCSSVGQVGNICFKPHFNWPRSVDSVEFSKIIVNSAGPMSGTLQPNNEIVYYRPKINRILPTTAVKGDPVTVFVPWLAIDASVKCAFKHIDDVILVPAKVSRRSAECIVPQFANVSINDVITISLRMYDDMFNLESTQAFFYYVDSTSQLFYTSFDHNNIWEYFDVDPLMTISWQQYDETTARSLVKLSSERSSARTEMRSKALVLDQYDQNVIVDFSTGSLSPGRILEVGALSNHTDASYIRGAIDIDSSGKASITISYLLDMTNAVSQVCSGFSANVDYSFVLKIVRPEIELMHNNITGFYEWLRQQNITTNMTEAVPDQPWRLDALLKTSQGEVVCKTSLNTWTSQISLFKERLSNNFLTIAQGRTGARDIKSATEQTNSIWLDRIWIACQYEYCNVTTVPKNVPEPKADRVTNIMAKKVVTALSTVAGGFLLVLLLALLVPIAFFVIWRLLARRRVQQKAQSHQAKLDAWRSPLDDERFGQFAKRMYKTDDEESKLRHLFLRKLSKVQHFDEVESSDVASDNGTVASSHSDAQLLQSSSSPTQSLADIRESLLYQ